MKPKKHFGQNFLKSNKALGDIVASAKIGRTDTVVEIGPGKGALTERLLQVAGKVVAIEKDSDLIPFLEEKFAKEIDEKKLILVHDDILKWNPKSQKLSQGKYILVANIPFYITGAILEYFLAGSFQPKTMALILQKEVAERIVARDGKGSILSLSVQIFGKPTYVGKIPARYFSPPPRVDSAILVIEDIKHMLSPAEEKRFFSLIKSGFGQKRKTLVKNIVSLGIHKEKIVAALQEIGFPETVRAENLSLSDWKSLISLM